jgi:16S rRNA (guanine(966)-N(2))-methyltransferase RsmD
VLRIFSGIYKGRRLLSATSDKVRPTTAKVKLSFFDTIQKEIRESIFLDGFGGSGNIGIEALSRGAEYVVFIDVLPESIKYLKKNIEKIGISSDHYRIIKGDYNRSVISLGKDGFKFDIIFLDPPYKLLDLANPLKVIHKRNILSDDGIIVLERPTRTDFDAKFFYKYKTNKLGKKCLDFYRKEDKEKDKDE